ncbi:uncharacterized protein SCODWIG_00303 [Saccharomycodes ludwigii]|uniref:Uncharacterized protein n=1 Tax=Saccharomycodes ludwigii TaxID=36035 RepID=A0A376B1N0_9ASCO|nr:uncharacterized protein SCODWIG_00303 [Saccharomycodes ludwigii]
MNHIFDLISISDEDKADVPDLLISLVINELYQMNYKTAEFIGEILFTECLDLIDNSPLLPFSGSHPVNTRASVQRKPNYKKKQLKKKQLSGIYHYCYAMFMNKNYHGVLEITERYIVKTFNDNTGFASTAKRGTTNNIGHNSNDGIDKCNNEIEMSGFEDSLLYENLGLIYLFSRSSFMLNKKLKESLNMLLEFESVWGDLIKSIPYDRRGSYGDNNNNINTKFFDSSLLTNSNIGGVDFEAGMSTNTMNDMLYGYPNVATLNSLVGKIYYKMDLVKESCFYHSRALGYNPYLWESVEELFKMGADIKLYKLYKMDHNDVTSTDSNNIANNSKKRHHERVESNNITSLNPTASFESNTGDKGANKINNKRWKLRDTDTTKSFFNSPKVKINTAQRNDNTDTNTPSNRLTNKKQQRKNDNSTLLTPPPLPVSTIVPDISTTALPFIESKKSPGATHLRSTNFVPEEGYPYNRNNSKPAILSFIDEKRNYHNLVGSNADNGKYYINGIFYYLGKILKATLKYDSYKAIRMLGTNLPRHYTETMPWCIAQLGILHFEIVNYGMSEKYFERLRRLTRTRVQDMDVYSTLLWHLKDKSKLSYLSHELLDIAPLLPQTWCCIGNLFSSLKNHEDAIKCFQKAIKLDPYFTYAYTLEGHEFSNNDAFDTAKNCYRKSLSISPNHYNAYYGLGMCSLKVGKYEESLFYFQKAQSINRANVILLCCCGVSLEKLNYKEEALKFYDIACELQPDSSLALFKKSYLLMEMGSYNMALINFEKLITIVPDEATVHFLLGKLYKILGREQDSLKEFTVAMTLDPKGSQMVKDSMTEKS